MAGFVYNPSESIRQDFQQAGSSLGNIFSQVIQQKQRDYSLAENTYANIEALKKDLNIYGQKSITTKANALLGHASSAILANGKLDYDKLGEIRQAVSDIKDLKTGYELGSKEYERMLQIGLANKDNLVSFEGFYKDLSAKMSDENLIKNPRDLQAALADTYTKSLDATKMFGKSYLASNPYQKVAYDVKDPKTGAMVRVQGELPTNWTIDPSTGKATPPAPRVITNADGTQMTIDYADQALAQLKATNPDTLAAMRRQAGFAGQNMSDKQLVEFYTSKIPMATQTQQIKSAEQITAEKQAVEKGILELQYLPKDLEQKQKLVKSQIEQNQAQTYRIYNPVEKSGGMNFNFGGGRTEKNVNNFLKISDDSGSTGKSPATLSTTISKPFSMNLENYLVYSNDPLKPGTKKKAPLGDFEVNAVKKIAGGKYIISGLQGSTKTTTDIYADLGASVPAGNRKRVNITLDQKGFDSVLNRLHGLGTEDQVENLNTIEMMQYLSTKAEAGRIKDVNKRMPLSQVQALAAEKGVPVLTMMGALKNEGGITIYQD
jgi:hypothetical protein